MFLLFHRSATTMFSAILLLLLPSLIVASNPSDDKICENKVDEVVLIGMLKSHLLVITRNSAKLCSYLLSLESLDPTGDKISLYDGQLLETRWNVLYKQFTGNTIYYRITVRDTKEGGVLLCTQHESYVFTLESNQLAQIDLHNPFGFDLTMVEHISSTEQLTFIDVDYGNSMVKKYLFASDTVNVITKMASFSLVKSYSICSSDDDTSVIMKEVSLYTQKGNCNRKLNWNNYGKSGFTDGKRMFVFSNEVVRIFDLDAMSGQLEKAVKVTVVRTQDFFTMGGSRAPTPNVPSNVTHSNDIPNSEPNDGPNTTGSSSSTGIIIAIVVILIVVLIGGGLAYFCFFSKDPEPVKNKSAKKPKVAEAGKVETGGVVSPLKDSAADQSKARASRAKTSSKGNSRPSRKGNSSSRGRANTTSSKNLNTNKKVSGKVSGKVSAKQSSRKANSSKKVATSSRKQTSARSSKK